MADFTVVNATGEIIEDVNAGDDDLAVGVNESVTLDGTEMLALLLTDGVAVLADESAPALRLAVADALMGDGDLSDLAVVSASAVTGVATRSTLGASAILALIDAGGAVVAQSVSSDSKAKLAKVLESGTNPAKRT